MKNTELDLIGLLAPCADTAQQADILERLILDRFKAALAERDLLTKRDLYWSITRKLLSIANELINPQSWLLLADDKNWKSLFWSSDWKWHDRMLAQTGPQLRRELASLDADQRLHHELQLHNLVMALVNHVLWDLAREDFPDPRRPYAVEIDGEYPFRNLDGSAHVLSLDTATALDPDAASFIASLIDPKLDPASRSRLAHTYLYPGRVKEHHLLTPLERPLIGQFGVFAKRHIPAGTCVGIYGGPLLDNADRIMVTDRRYLAKCGGVDGKGTFINGENIMSLMNTTFRYDTCGAIVSHDGQRTNIRAQSFRCKTAGGTPVSPLAFFVTTDINEDCELRWSYGYGNEAFSDLTECVTAHATNET
jgi:hypothetical protein